MAPFERYIVAALKLGFSHAVFLPGLKLCCRPEIRKYCNWEQCQNYGTTWVCPPGCGSIEECQERVLGYRAGIVVQTVGKIPPHDGKWEKLCSLRQEHNSRLHALADRIRAEGCVVLPLTTGGCTACESCTFPKRPCRKPERRMHALSAYGINVGDLCKQAGLEYSFTEDIVYYTACLLLK
ncbi:MAG: DUF2284 domain-containing protein [Peptococcaceae bacterium]|nr:DUF2284 domain-containing protein [Peptococcaceae bacterium]